MKKLLFLLFASIASFGSIPLKAQTMQTCEYWFDYDFAGRQSKAMNGVGTFQQQFDLSALPSGVHSIGLRFGDSEGRWGASLVKHFVVPSLPAETYPDNKIIKMEYWLDYAFDQRQVLENTDGVVAITLNLASLPSGVHSFAYRALDSRGIWSSPILKHFVVPSLPAQTYPDNKIVSMEYWLDYDFANRQTLENTDGTVALTLDLATLSPGAHSIAYRALDSRGIWTSPILKHFVVPSLPEPAITGMAAYEYWFNHGPRVHVDVDPQNPLTLNEVVIEVKDVWVDVIRDDYRLDVESGTVLLDDEVFFGIQAFDDQGHASQAVVSDKFAMTVPIFTEWTQLKADIPSEAVAPEVSHITGFKMTTTPGDILCWEVEGVSGKLRLHNADGTKLDSDVFRNTDGRLACAAKAASAQTYALLYDVSEPKTSITAICKVLQRGDVNADHAIDVADIATVISCMSGSAGVSKMLSDLNSDGVVDVADIATVISIMAGAD